MNEHDQGKTKESYEGSALIFTICAVGLALVFAVVMLAKLIGVEL